MSSKFIKHFLIFSMFMTSWAGGTTSLASTGTDVFQSPENLAYRQQALPVQDLSANLVDLQSKLETISKSFGLEALNAGFDSESGVLGVNQVYTAQDLGRTVFVKLEVELDQPELNEKILSMDEEYLYHAKTSDGHAFAIMFKNFDLHSVHSFVDQIKKSRLQASFTTSKVFRNLRNLVLLPEAQAQDSAQSCIPGLSGAPLKEAQLGVFKSRLSDQYGEMGLVAFLSHCVTATAKGAGKGLLDAAKGLAKGIEGAWSFVTHPVISTRVAWRTVSTSFDNLRKIAHNLVPLLNNSVSEFAELSSAKKGQLLCGAISEFGVASLASMTVDGTASAFVLGKLASLVESSAELSQFAGVASGLKKTASFLRKGEQKVSAIRDVPLRILKSVKNKTETTLLRLTKSAEIKSVEGLAGRPINGDEILRINRTEKALARKLTPEQAKGILDSHRVGEGEIGADGKTFASIGNYTKNQKIRKGLILRKTGFTRAETKKILDLKIAGSETEPQLAAAHSLPKAMSSDIASALEKATPITPVRLTLRVREVAGAEQIDRALADLGQSNVIGSGFPLESFPAQGSRTLTIGNPDQARRLQELMHRHPDYFSHSSIEAPKPVVAPVAPIAAHSLPKAMSSDIASALEKATPITPVRLTLRVREVAGAEQIDRALADLGQSSAIGSGFPLESFPPRGSRTLTIGNPDQARRLQELMHRHPDYFSSSSI